jgi:N-methylhydantoinase B/oxoprolinase/acetone carboxylase alpha subunit
MLCDTAATVLSEGREHAPYGAPGGRRRNTVIHADGREEVVGSKAQVRLAAGDRRRIETPDHGALYPRTRP